MDRISYSISTLQIGLSQEKFNTVSTFQMLLGLIYVYVTYETVQCSLRGDVLTRI